MTYTQPPPLAKEEIDSFLKNYPIAHISTHNRDGTIHSAPVWFLYKANTFIIGSPAASRKVRNLKNNRNATILIDNPETAVGVLVYGEAELDFGYGFDEAAEIYEKYMSHEQAMNFARNMSRESKGGGVKITVKPNKIITFDTRKDEFLRSMAEK
jgi:hypothetical protein